MLENRLAVWISTAVLAFAGTPAMACEVAPPEPPEVVAEHVRNRQADLWDRSDAVFLSAASGFERIALVGGGGGFATTLIPALALKGGLPAEGVAIRHRTLTSCGPIPFLDALSGHEGDWFVTYVRNLPSGQTVDATVPVADLVDEEALRAWRKAYPSQAVTPEN